jgi:hypothetical protein
MLYEAVCPSGLCFQLPLFIKRTLCGSLFHGANARRKTLEMGACYTSQQPPEPLRMSRLTLFTLSVCLSLAGCQNPPGTAESAAQQVKQGLTDLGTAVQSAQNSATAEALKAQTAQAADAAKQTLTTIGETTTAAAQTAEAALTALGTAVIEATSGQGASGGQDGTTR